MADKGRNDETHVFRREDIKRAFEMAEERDKNGRRWYDSVKVIWGLFGLLGTLVLASAGVLWRTADAARDMNAAQDVKIQRLEVLVETTGKRLDRMELTVDDSNRKLDEVLRRLQK